MPAGTVSEKVIRIVKLRGGPYDGMVIQVPEWMDHFRIRCVRESYVPGYKAKLSKFRTGWYRADKPGAWELKWRGWVD